MGWRDSERVLLELLQKWWKIGSCCYCCCLRGERDVVWVSVEVVWRREEERRTFGGRGKEGGGRKVAVWMSLSSSSESRVFLLFF